jgi:hypothetical protein
MSFRFRLGPITFGSTGIRLSLWRRRLGLSIPLFGKGHTFGKLGFGPFIWFFRGLSAGHWRETNEKKGQPLLGPYEKAAINGFRSDRQFLEKLRRYDLPWRGVQERLKKELPDLLSNRDNIAHNLVSKAMDTVFGPQEKSWKTERRPSKSRVGYTTWIVIIGKGDGR